MFDSITNLCSNILCVCIDVVIITFYPQLKTVLSVFISELNFSEINNKRRYSKPWLL